MKTVCVIGHPIKHSRSPLIHSYWMEQLGIDGQYLSKDVPPDELSRFIKNLKQSPFIGCNVTLPHKEAACTAIDFPDERVHRIGALNTIYLRGENTYATSTDGHGFVQNVKWRQPSFQFVGAKIVLIGAGGSARAIIDELLREKVSSITIINRTSAKAINVARHFGAPVNMCEQVELANVLPNCDLLINTTSAGIANSEELILPLDKLPSHAIVADINYVPLITPLLLISQNRGLAIVPGLGMLLYQAVLGFELWFGKQPTVTQELYDLVARDIDQDYRP